MSRPSLAPIRRRQILDAFENCILRFGFEGSTLERIATEAGMKRSVVRHYMGNRDEMTRALVAGTIRRTEEAHTAALAKAATHPAPGGLIDFIAGPGFPDPREDALMDALMAASHRNPELRSQLCDIYRAFRQAIANQLRETIPLAPPRAVRRAAHALTCLAYGHATMIDIGLTSRDVNNVRVAAHAIVEDLSRSANP